METECRRADAVLPGAGRTDVDAILARLAKSPLAFKIGAILMWASTLVLAGLLVPQLAKKEPAFGVAGKAALVALACGAISAAFGYGVHESRMGRIRTLQREQNIGEIGPDERLAAGNTLFSLTVRSGLREFGSPRDADAVADVVLARSVIAIIHRYDIPKRHKTMAALQGGLVGMGVEKAVHASLSSGLAKAAEKERESDRTKALSEVVRRRKRFALLPARDVGEVRRQADGPIVITHASGSLVLDGNEDAEARLKAWVAGHPRTADAASDTTVPQAPQSVAYARADSHTIMVVITGAMALGFPVAAFFACVALGAGLTESNPSPMMFLIGGLAALIAVGLAVAVPLVIVCLVCEERGSIAGRGAGPTCSSTEHGGTA